MTTVLYNGSPGVDGDEQRFYCSVENCGKCYRQKRNLMIHIKLDHADPETIEWHHCQAENCTKSFKYKCALNRHIGLYHSGAETREAMLAKRRKNQEVRMLVPNEEKKWRVLVGDTEADPESKLFQCCHAGCTRMFTSKGSLNLHIERKHERPGAFVCPVDICGRQFSYKHVLQTHIERVHHLPFNHEDYPNPKRQRTPRNKSAVAASTEPAVEPGTMLVVASDSDSEAGEVGDAANEVVPEAVSKVEEKAQPARATRGSARATRNSALGNLADMAAAAATTAAGTEEGEATASKTGKGTTVALYECDHPGCGKVFSWKGSLALHQDRIHKMPDSYQCPVEDCYKNFSYKHVLQQHLRRVHKLDSKN